MATNLVELTKSYFTPELVQKISALVGESPPTTPLVSTQVCSEMTTLEKREILHYWLSYCG